MLESFSRNDDDEQIGNEKKKFKGSLYKPPTSSELNELKETENLFHSNLFRMQISELLTEISLKDTETDKIKAICEEIIGAIESFKSVKEQHINDIEIFKKHNIRLPLSDLIENETQRTYKFKPPKKVEFIGSFIKKCTINPFVCIDIGIEMPSEYFSERDFLNYLYFIKRILYMAHVCVKLLKLYEDAYDFHFESETASVYKPYLVMKLKKSTGASYQIRFHFMAHKDTFNLHRFKPTMNNVRKKFFFQEHANNEAASSDNVPTPHYNFEILSDLRSFELNQVLNESLTVSKSLIDGVKLLKLWLCQRRLNQGFGSFNNFILSVFVSHLISIKRINALMSSYQIFRIVLLNLSQAKWETEGLTLSVAANKDDPHCLNVSEYHKYYDVVFIDSSKYLNICSNVTKNTFKRVKHEADLAIKFLNDQFIDSFDALFMRKLRLFESFDSVISINSLKNENLFQKIVNNKGLDDKLIDNYKNYIAVATPIIEEYLEKALNNRIRLLFTQLQQNLEWPINSNIPTQSNSISIGLLFDKNYTNVLVKGPASNLPEAREFRSFWGEKSDLRRFQDSTICEAVYFEANTMSEKRIVYSKIIKHIMKLHLEIDEVNIQTLDRQLDDVISLPKEIIDNYGTGEERFANVIHIFEDLVRMIKGLKDMPLNFSNIQAISSTFSLTNTFSPLPCCFKYDLNSEKNLRSKQNQKYLPVYPLGKCIAPYVEPIKISCQLETSNQWPDDLECIKRLKCAFTIKLVQLLRDTQGLLAFSNLEFCDVFYKGFVFRLIVQTTRELSVARTSVDDNGVIISRDTEESLKIEKNIFHLTKITSVLHGLQQEYNHFSGVARLAKRWLSCQMLLDLYNEEAIDLLCAYLFVHPEPFEPPSSIAVGFIRFISLLSNFDFKTQPIIINFNNEFKKEDLVEIQLNFQTNRSQLPLIYIATSYDANKKYSIWTRTKPELQTLCRTILLAKECFKKIETFSLNLNNFENFKSLFKPSTSMYDVIIHLVPEYCPRAYQKLELATGTFLSHYRDYDEKVGEKGFPIVDFDPVQLFVKQLRETFSEFALFFYDEHGATDIYVLWKPKSFEPKEFKIVNINGRTLDSSGKKLIPNIETIIEDFKIIGHELVKDITIRTDKLANFN